MHSDVREQTVTICPCVPIVLCWLRLSDGEEKSGDDVSMYNYITKDRESCRNTSAL